MKKCLCLLLAVVEPCLHQFGIHTGIEGIAPVLFNYAVTLEE